MSSALLDHPLIAQRYFFPRQALLADPFWVEVEGARLACYYRRAHPGAKTIVHFHGNGEVVADYLDGFVPILEQFGFNCFLAEFRGYGDSTGTPKLGRLLDDVVPIIRSIGQPEQELVLFGRSVGSLFALQGAALFPKIAGLILESAVADPLERLLLRVAPEELGVSPGAFASEVAKRLDHRRKMAAYRGPSLLLHTRNDGLIDVSHAERLYRWARGRKILKLFSHGNHNDIMAVNARDYFTSLREFLLSL